ncbi:3-methyladenine DNA glycosylase [Arsenicicoccus piscis]|uniref:3-methyladenine DNA glycosylase n=1 Tax=Arsenicicoccus piscis TaxID=673954 RepID=A0ABQ6HL25_9MICO|nr:3-methyladenine DNA glycosylase [Arsenicicoccus piscis]MCH8626923.1 3-methyladenine DNA glycosylase [Arsenicicoccus piscis]GMA19161.1 hypothetical protein GCM10025862_11820 [Arsenicicoccus piscis]
MDAVTAEDRAAVVLEREQWLPRAEAHQRRAEAATREHRARRARGQKHPLEDFLFEYYGFHPGHLARWHPGPHVVLRDAPEHAGWRHYTTAGVDTSLDLPGYLAARGRTVEFVRDLLVRTDSRDAQFGCFGLHEWAMVYRSTPDNVRHQGLPLRLGHAGTDAVVEAHEIRCSHYDAFRFFTPDARPRNLLAPDRDGQRDNEQPGCLHAGAMDLYRWSFKLAPGIPSDLLMDCFDLAREARILDMRSSPYEVSSLGHTNLAIETPAGKAEHVRRQRAIADRAGPLRRRLIAACEALITGSGAA